MLAVLHLSKTIKVELYVSILDGSGIHEYLGSLSSLSLADRLCLKLDTSWYNNVGIVCYRIDIASSQQRLDTEQCTSHFVELRYHECDCVI